MFDDVILDYPKETPANHVSNICHVFEGAIRTDVDNMVDIIDIIVDIIV